MASRFWVGGTGTWDASDTTHWAASTGGAGGQSVPGSADAVVFDGSSGGGTVTLNFGGTISLQSIAMGAFTGTWDNSVNNNPMTLSVLAGFSGTGSATRSVKLGSATYTLTATQGAWQFTITTGLTLTASSATIVMSAAATTSARSFAGGGQTYGTLSLAANASGGATTLTGANTFGTITVTGPNTVTLPASTTTIATTLTLPGAAGSGITLQSSTGGTAATISVASNAPTLTYCSIRDITATGGATFTATNSVSLVNNTGITFSSGGSSTGISRARAFAGM